MSFVVNQDTRSSIARSQAFREFHGDLAIRRGLSRVHMQLFTHMLQQFFSTTQHAADASTDPDPMLTQFVFFVFEELVERHRVVDFRRMQFEQLGDFTHSFD